jgi:ribosomal subunit interface protein
MNAKITFRHMERSQVIEDYAERQLQKVYEFLSNEREPVYVELTFEPSKVHAHHRVELLVKSPHYDLITHREGPEFYDLIDKVVDIMYHNLHEEKRREIDERKMRGRHEEFKKQR